MTSKNRSVDVVLKLPDNFALILSSYVFSLVFVYTFFAGCTLEKLPPLDEATTPTATFDRNGKLWIVWVHGEHLYVNYSTNKGRSFSRPVKVNSAPEPIRAHGDSRPKIAVAKNGNIYVSYTQQLEKRFTTLLRFSRSIDGGKSFSAPISVNDDHDLITGHSFEVLAVDAGGKIYLAWIDGREGIRAEKSGGEYNGSSLYYTTSDDEGLTFKTNRKVVDHICQCCRMAIDFDHDDLPVVLFRNIFGDNIRDHAVVKLTDEKLMRVSNENWFIDGCPHHGGAMFISNDNGTCHVAIFTAANDRPRLLYAKRERSKSVFSEAMEFGLMNGGHPSVLEVRSSLYILWKNEEAKGSTLELISSTDGGDSWSEARQIKATSGESDHPFLMAHDGEIYVSWFTENEGYQFFSLY